MARGASAASVAERPELVISLGSLSKTLGMTGWRIGHITASPDFIRQALKVQDATAICAPIIAQVAALAALEHMPAYPRSMVPELDRRRALFESAIEGISQLRWRKTDGALFAMVRADSGDSDLAWDIMERVGVLTVPGGAFGERWSGYLRISYGCGDGQRYEEALDRLGAYFRTA